MIKTILFISLCYALAWAGATALFAKSGWTLVAFIKSEYVPYVFVITGGATFLVLCFIVSAWRGEPGR